MKMSFDGPRFATYRDMVRMACLQSRRTTGRSEARFDLPSMTANPSRSTNEAARRGDRRAVAIEDEASETGGAGHRRSTLIAWSFDHRRAVRTVQY